ncbi:MAG: DUF3747 domain-containing protein [Prochlorococcaceae cyanobacterium]
MLRTYLALAGLALVPASLAPSLGRAAALFSAEPLDGSRFAILARPVGRSDWNLLVLEQLRPQPACWAPRGDGLVDPSLNRFDFTNICSRYLDSNGYSLRIADQDLATSFRLRLQQVGDELLLQAVAPDQPAVLTLGRGAVPLRDRDGFVALELDAGWQLQRRSFEGRSLNHVYFANGTELATLVARATSERRPVLPLTRLPRTAKPPALLPPAPAMGRGEGAVAAGDDEAPPGRTIALQVIPYGERSAATP